ncbi:helix-turn-helix domain-containing protein [Limisphaera sp. VF-2]|jgi:transcriptional regulator with XRE-family HTH domain|uniref:helix-turn-helix domain-containing protein n=1 Tax=Limisphaera sp. VF-2 TaxID=3400418 RepID=UPI00175B6358|nr:helix-turn-helix transcriptional regulator [Limisphaera sp.]
MTRKEPVNLVGARVKIARLRRNPPLTQDELSGQLAAYGIQLDRIAISRIERGHRYVTDREVLAFSKVLGVSPAWLLGMEK